NIVQYRLLKKYMGETRNNINSSQQPLLNDKKTDVLQQAVEREYIKLFRKIHKTTQKSIL
ncbi:unnamed protein product, partial [Adineta steineri]